MQAPQVQSIATNIENIEMNSQYSSTAFLIFTLGMTMYSCLFFYSYGIVISHGILGYQVTFGMATASTILRFLALVSLWLIWAVKPGRNGSPFPKFSQAMAAFIVPMQVSFLLMISVSLALRLVTNLLAGSCRSSLSADVLRAFCGPYYEQGGMTLYLAVEIMFIPILTAFLLRDTPLWALTVAWIVAVAILLTFAIELRSVDIGIATAAYAYCTVLISLDSLRQHQERTAVLMQLRTALTENERLARQEQAKELRAMMGNMAHDLKTPLTSFLNGLECILEVIQSWEARDRDSAHAWTPHQTPHQTPQKPRRMSYISDPGEGYGADQEPVKGAAEDDQEQHPHDYQHHGGCQYGEPEQQLQHQHRQEQLDSANSFLARTHGNLSTIKRCVAGMKSTTSFMTMSINRCLDYTKTNAGVRLVPKLETVYLKALLEMPVKMMRDLQHNQPIVLDLPGEGICSHIITDKQWLLENLLCLLSNAVKYSYRGKVDVSVLLVRPPYHTLPMQPAAGAGEQRGQTAEKAPQAMQAQECGDVEMGTRQQEQSGRNSSVGNVDAAVGDEFLRFEVQDTGIGLSDEAMQTLFNPFKQAQRMAGGTGLGLFSLAKRVEALHGQYGVSRRPDGAQGSLFWFTIPYRPDTLSAALNSESSEASSTIISLSDETPQEARTAPSGVGIAAPTVDSLHRHNHPQEAVTSAVAPASVHPHQRIYNVLLVDDAPLIVKMTTMLLTRKGHTVTTAVNGADALEHMLAGYERQQEVTGPPYDVVLMDLQMPIMDGPLAMRRLRTAEAQYCSAAVRSSFSAGGSSAASTVTIPLQRDGGGQIRHELEEHKSPSGTGAQSGRGGGSSSKVGGQPLGQEEDGGAERGGATLSSVAGQVSSRSVGQRYHQFVIAVSANSDHETVQEALRAGADTFMTKPFAYEAFAEIMEHHAQQLEMGGVALV